MLWEDSIFSFPCVFVDNRRPTTEMEDFNIGSPEYSNTLETFENEFRMPPDDPPPPSSPVMVKPQSENARKKTTKEKDAYSWKDDLNVSSSILV